MFNRWMELAERAVTALERIADALEAARPRWIRMEEVEDKREVLTRGR